MQKVFSQRNLIKPVQDNQFSLVFPLVKLKTDSIWSKEEGKVIPVTVFGWLDRLERKENLLKDGRIIKVIIDTYQFTKRSKVTVSIKFPGDKAAPNNIIEKIKEQKSLLIRGNSKGRGFIGVIKKFGYAGGNASHGNSRAHRLLGSTGVCSKSVKHKFGLKIAGRRKKKVSWQNLKLLIVDEEKKFIILKGLCPGKNKSICNIVLSYKSINQTL